MKARKYAIVAVMVASTMFASCKKENNQDESGTVFSAVIEQSEGDGGKTELDPSNGHVTWMVGDQFKLAQSNGQGSTATFTLMSGEEGKMTSKFVSQDFNQEPTYIAAYPAAIMSFNSSGQLLRVNLPSAQSLPANVSGTFGNGANPMIAEADGNMISFKNLCGGLGIPLTGSKHISRITLTTKKANEKLYGSFHVVDCSSTNPEIDQDMMDQMMGAGGSMITLNCDVTLTSEVQWFFIMLPPGTLSEGFELAVYDGETLLLLKETTSSLALQERNVIKRISTPFVLSDGPVVTNSPTFITTSSAFNGGTVNGFTPVECGVVYALAGDLSSQMLYDANLAEVENNLVIGGNGVTRIVATTGTSFTTEGMTGLTEDMVYYVRAYAKDDQNQVFYGKPIPFATRKTYADGMLRGEFRINPNDATKKVRFSMGNLQYTTVGTHATAEDGTLPGTWRFAEYQFEYVGQDANDGLVYANGMHPDASLNGTKSANEHISSTYTGWIDHFAWGTSGYNHGAVCYQPWSISNSVHDYYAYGVYNNCLYMSTGKADWGYNAIINGGNTEHYGWRSLRGGVLRDLPVGHKYYFETGYLIVDDNSHFSPRPGTIINGEVARASQARLFVRDNRMVNGVILYPETVSGEPFSWPYRYINHFPRCFPSFTPGTCEFYFSVPSSSDPHNQWTEAEWSLLEYSGCVFMPVNQYWTSSLSQDNYPERAGYLGVREGAMYYYVSDVGDGDAVFNRFGVRLVYDVQ